MKCPNCGKGCVQTASEVIAGIEQRYMACRDCAPEPNLDKTRPLKALPGEVERCKSCGRAPLDAVMLDALRVLEEFGLRDKRDTLRSVGSPLISVGYPLAYSPRIGPHDLIIAGERLGKAAAEAIVKRIPEVKGVILNKCVPGVSDSLDFASENVLLAGCDMRADVAQSIFGELVIYKSQSKIHIEFSRHSAPKMRILEQLYFEGKIRDVVDGLCGPGTLGLMCALAGAKRVVLNDAWLPGVQNVQLNLKVNQEAFGIGGDRVSRETRCNRRKGSGACRPRKWAMPDRSLPWRPDKALYESATCWDLPHRPFSRSKYRGIETGLQMLQRDSNSIIE